MQVPIQTIHLFPKLDSKLIELLRSLSPADWLKTTLAKQWTVKDIATHLLDGNIRTLSTVRDRYLSDPESGIQSYVDLVNYINQLNAEWVKATKRMSPIVLIELLETTGKEYSEVLSKLDPFGPSVFSVAWAGQRESPNWFHVAREYTEKWHHQQQIREAVGKPAIMSREFFYPLIDTFMQALPYTFRNIKAEKNTAINITITGDLGGEWLMLMNDTGWTLKKSRVGNIKAGVAIDPNTAWKLFTNAISEEDAERKTTFSGDEQLGKNILKMRSVMV